MKKHIQTGLSILVFASLVLSACRAAREAAGSQVTVSIVYGSEKREWLEPLVEQFNNEKHQTPNGATIVVEATPMGSLESIALMLEGQLQPTVWSPASSVYVPVANAEWRKKFGNDLVTGTPNDLALSPVVIAMWKPMAEALGWPDKPLGWADVATLATSNEDWAAYGYPEWGEFKFGHTHPAFSNSGVVSILAGVYAGANKQRDLTLDDIHNPQVAEFVAEVQGTIIFDGSSTAFFAERMFKNGPFYLSAAVLYENLVVAQETKRLAAREILHWTPEQVPIVAIYPKEGTFWANNPYILVNAPWVTDEQKAAAEAFEQFLLDKPQQLKALEVGFRPADTSIPLTSPLDAEHGVDINQPQTILEAPKAEVIQAAQSLWSR
jgi:Ca-activated chloride channel family protein